MLQENPEPCTGTGLRTSIKCCVGFPAVKSTAEYGVHPFWESETHRSLSPYIKDSIDSKPNKDYVRRSDRQKSHTVQESYSTDLRWSPVLTSFSLQLCPLWNPRLHSHLPETVRVNM